MLKTKFCHQDSDAVTNGEVLQARCEGLEINLEVIIEEFPMAFSSVHACTEEGEREGK